MLEDNLGVRAALAAPPFSSFCELRSDEPPRRGHLSALTGGDPSQPHPHPHPQHNTLNTSHTLPRIIPNVEGYGRSAAGVIVEPAHLRTPLALEKSMHFLVQHYIREPHTPAVFLTPFEVWQYLWDRMRQVRTNWVPQLPPVGSVGVSQQQQQHNNNNNNGEIMDSIVLESKRRLQWLEFTVAALAVGGANLCRSIQGCRRFMAEKQNFLESIAQCFSDLVISYRAEHRLRNSEMFSAVIIFYGLSQLSKIENRAGFCPIVELSTSSDISSSTTTTTQETTKTIVFEFPSKSVNFSSVYRELSYLPGMARTRHVRLALELIHCWCHRAWFRFFYICRKKNLTTLQKAMIFQSFSYARFRAVVDLVTANTVVYGKARLRGEILITELAELLLMQPEHCLELLEVMGLHSQLNEDRTILKIARTHDSSPYTTQEAIHRHLEKTGGKQRLCFPTIPEFFGFTVWKRAFELFPDAFSSSNNNINNNNDNNTVSSLSSSPSLKANMDLRNMNCPVNLMQLLEPYCPPYNNDVAALELTDAGNEWFAGIQEARERMLLWNITHISHSHRYNLNRNDNNNNNFGSDAEDEDDEFYNNNNNSDDNYDNIDSYNEKKRAAIEDLDRESKSTHSSIFDDISGSDDCNMDENDNDENIYYNDNNIIGNKYNEGENEFINKGEEEEEEEEEESEAQIAAKALLQSLQQDIIYAKIREELQKESVKSSESLDEFNTIKNNNINQQTSSILLQTTDKHQQEEEEEEEEEKEKEGQNKNKKEEINKKQIPGPWLTLPPPPKENINSVIVTPLPSDYSGEMSPNMSAKVETPKSTKLAPVPPIIPIEEEELEEEEEIIKDNDNNKIEIRRDDNKILMKERQAAAAPFPSFTANFPSHPINESILNKQQDKYEKKEKEEVNIEKSSVKRLRAEVTLVNNVLPTSPLSSLAVPFHVQMQKQNLQIEEKMEKDNNNNNNKRRRAEPTQNNYISLQQQKQQEEEVMNSSCTSSLANHLVLLPFEKSNEENKYSQNIFSQNNYSETESNEDPPSRRVRMEYNHQQLNKEEKEKEVVKDIFESKKITFVGPSSTSSVKPLLKYTNNKEGGVVSYQETIRAYLQKNRNNISYNSNALDIPSRSSSSSSSSLLLFKQQESKQKEQNLEETLLSSSFLAELNNSVREDAPQWMRVFTHYLIRFFTKSYHNSYACRLLSEIISGSSEAKLSEIAGWLCRGFTPSMISYKKIEFYPNNISSHSPTTNNNNNNTSNAIEKNVSDVPVLRLASTVVVFGSGIRENNNNNNFKMNNIYRENSISLGRWVAALMLDKQDAAYHLMHGFSYNNNNNEESSISNNNYYNFNNNDNTDGGQIGLWEQFHKLQLPTVGAAHSTSLLSPAGIVNYNNKYNIINNNAEISSYSQDALLQTQLTLYAVDYCDASQLRFCQQQQEEEIENNHINNSNIINNNNNKVNSIEHITAIITLDASKGEGVEYQEGIKTLHLLIQHAARRRSVFLAGVIIILYTNNIKEDIKIQQEVEEKFWEMWKQYSSTEEEEEKEKEVLNNNNNNINFNYNNIINKGLKGSSSYQSILNETKSRISSKATIHREVSKSMNKNNNYNNYSFNNSIRKNKNIIHGFFSKGDTGKQKFNSLTNIKRPKAPSPVFTVLPIQTAINNKNNNNNNNMNDVIMNNAPGLRLAIRQAVETLLRGYEIKWKEFVQNKNYINITYNNNYNIGGEEENVLCNLTPNVCI